MHGRNKVKLIGPRSIESKLRRLAYELEADAARIRADHLCEGYLADTLQDLSSRLGKLGRSISNEG